MSPFQSSIRANRSSPEVSVRTPTRRPRHGTPGADGRDIAVTTSHEFVVRARAKSTAVIRLVALAPEQDEFVVDRRPGGPARR